MTNLPHEPYTTIGVTNVGTRLAGGGGVLVVVHLKRMPSVDLYVLAVTSPPKKAVAAATQEADVHVMFLIDKSGSMSKAIDAAKEALAKMLGGFPLEKLHIAAFDTMGYILKPKAASRLAVQHMLAPLKGEGGTVHAAGVLRRVHRRARSAVDRPWQIFATIRPTPADQARP
jgi:hypothetical protein